MGPHQLRGLGLAVLLGLCVLSLSPCALATSYGDCPKTCIAPTSSAQKLVHPNLDCVKMCKACLNSTTSGCTSYFLPYFMGDSYTKHFACWENCPMPTWAWGAIGGAIFLALIMICQLVCCCARKRRENREAAMQMYQLYGIPFDGKPGGGPQIPRSQPQSQSQGQRQSQSQPLSHAEALALAQGPGQGGQGGGKKAGNWKESYFNAFKGSKGAKNGRASAANPQAYSPAPSSAPAPSAAPSTARVATHHGVGPAKSDPDSHSARFPPPAHGSLPFTMPSRNAPRHEGGGSGVRTHPSYARLEQVSSEAISNPLNNPYSSQRL